MFDLSGFDCYAVVVMALKGLTIAMENIHNFQLCEGNKTLKFHSK